MAVYCNGLIFQKKNIFLHLPCLFGFYFYFIYANLYLDTTSVIVK